MKKVVNVASIMFWLSFVLFIITFVVENWYVSPGREEKILQAVEIAHKEDIRSGKYVIVLAEDRAKPTFVLSALGIIMAICFTVMENVSEPKPKIKHGRSYMLIAIVPLSKKRGYSIVLSHDDKIETYQCSGISQNADPKIGSTCEVEIENEIVYFS